MPRADDPPEVQVVLARLDSHGEKLDEIHREVRRTNGRVTALEQQQAIDAALESRGLSSRDWLLRLLLAVIALASLIEPAVLFVMSR